MTELDLTLRYKVEQRDAGLLEMAVRAAENAAKAKSDLKSGQIKALLRQVQTGNGVEHICNWLRYQRAREPAWAKSGLFGALLADIADLRTDAQTLTREIHPRQYEERLPTVWLALVQRYVAYLYRKFVALRKGETDEE